MVKAIARVSSIEPHDARSIAAEAHCATSTVYNVVLNGRGYPVTRAAIIRAIKKLGLAERYPISIQA
jgi:hypothetical protein